MSPRKIYTPLNNRSFLVSTDPTFSIQGGLRDVWAQVLRQIRGRGVWTLALEINTGWCDCFVVCSKFCQILPQGTKDKFLTDALR